MPSRIGDQEIRNLERQFQPLIGLKIDWLSLPRQALLGFEPSQIAVIVNTLLDAALPQIRLLSLSPENAEKLQHVEFLKPPRHVGQREAYPDYINKSGKRFELKGLFVDNSELDLKRPPTRREPSARLKENVTIDNVEPANDVLFVAAIQLQETDDFCYPFIIDVGLFPMIECVEARDNRLYEAGGRWIDSVPKVVSKKGSEKLHAGQALGSEDYERDTNFGKLKRIPYPPLQDFLRKYRTI